jgi:putative ABC transport system permease protein
LALQRASLANFREAVALLVTTMASIYTGLAAIIAFGVVYNSARISLSERARELASLRVLGFTRAEVLRILLLELALLPDRTTAWMGHGLRPRLIMKTNLAGELMQSALWLRIYLRDRQRDRDRCCGAVGLIVRRRVDQLDLAAVLKPETHMPTIWSSEPPQPCCALAAASVLWFMAAPDAVDIAIAKGRCRCDR